MAALALPLPTADDRRLAVPVRPMVGVVPLFAVAVLDAGAVAHLDGFTARMEDALFTASALCALTGG